jgi:hypothetical protein
MFLNFINSLKVDISRQTEFLEACDWSEEDLAKLLQHANEAIFEINKSITMIDSFDEFEALFIERMSKHTPESQIHIILKHLKGSLQNNVLDKEIGC